MFDVFGSVKGLIRISPVRIDNNVFRLHYKLTVIILIAFSLLVTSKQYIGDPIDCMVDEIPPDVMDAFCWIYSTFTVPQSLGERVGLDVVQPGVRFHESGENVKYHKYYQWVCFALFFQALLFYIPHYLWKTWEAGRIAKLIKELNKPILQQEKNIRERVQEIEEYFRENFHLHSYYAWRFFFCEVLNFVVVVGQIYFVDLFLDGEFSTYGWEVVKFTNAAPEDRFDPMARVFPKVTKCTFHKYGPSGTVQKFDGLCVLPVNIVNEKIYVFLWFWFIILSVITGLYLVHRIVTILSSGYRQSRLLSIKSMADKNKVREISNACNVGAWFMLQQIASNLDPSAYKQLIEVIDVKKFV